MVSYSEGHSLNTHHYENVKYYTSTYSLISSSLPILYLCKRKWIRVHLAKHDHRIETNSFACKKSTTWNQEVECFQDFMYHTDLSVSEYYYRMSYKETVSTLKIALMDSNEITFTKLNTGWIYTDVRRLTL
jgi:hypothetical protein